MSAYVILALAIMSEVFGTTMLKLSAGFKRKLPLLGVAIGMGLSFLGLSYSLLHIPLGTAYAIWSGVGTAITAAIGVLVWKEKFTLQTAIGLVLVIFGVICIRLA